VVAAQAINVESDWIAVRLDNAGDAHASIGGAREAVVRVLDLLFTGFSGQRPPFDSRAQSVYCAIGLADRRNFRENPL
jgi:hypothetical protein